ncbi:ABC transporter permease/substrate-binding protein [Parasphingorhabdus sp. DH2-15]|uniref:ABC transporter permease/substrate-binding protein n=1 Tax=Parasphingorhabdus sp. DH2-15 TaxID=3444112 RepID=UPI003F68726C
MTIFGEAFADSFQRVPELLVEHVRISFSALALGLLIALPLAIWAARSKRVAQIALGFASLVQTIPALALLALFYPLLLALTTVMGDIISPLGFLPSLLALTLYALLPIMRNTVTGLNGVNPALKEAADGIGMTGWQKLRLVEGPLAAPTIMAGIRTASVWTIGAATLATTVGQASLGNLIFTGLQIQNWSLVLAGCISAAALAISVDILLGMVETGIAQRKRLRVIIASVLLALGLGYALLPDSSNNDDDTIVIGAKGFSEQYILARVIGQRLEEAGYKVSYREGLGSAVVFQAVSNGDIDISIDYSGTIWTNEMKREDRKPATQMLEEIGDWVEKTQGIKLLGALGFENTYAFAVRKDDAQRLDLKSLDDLARVSPQFTFGTDTEFLERPEWQSVEQAYDMNFKQETSFDPTFMYNALDSGQADVISAFSSDGRIAAYGFTVLDDPKGAVPAYDAMVMISPRSKEDTKLLSALQPLIGAIPVETMREANYQVDREEDKQTPDKAARWLRDALGF